MSDTAYWRELGLSWLRSPRQRLWRRFHDRAVGEWVAAHLPAGARSVLKTDLFEEAVGEPILAGLAERSSLAMGLDLALPLAAAARRRAGAALVVAAEVERLPLADGSVQVVVSTSTLDHFHGEDRLQRSLTELARVLAPGGTLLLTLDNLDNPVVRLRNRLVRSRVRAFGLVPYRVGATVGRAGLRRMLEASGLTPEWMGAVVHPVRSLAIPLCGWAERRWGRRGQEILLRWLSASEALGRLPTRFLTGSYLAVVARVPPSPSR